MNPSYDIATKIYLVDDDIVVPTILKYIKQHSSYMNPLKPIPAAIQPSIVASPEEPCNMLLRQTSRLGYKPQQLCYKREDRYRCLFPNLPSSRFGC